ncbi:MAG TPA: hypothetical protein VHX61_08700 [Rhizomicrobium sp.]|jgi:hypothetical protein|nr:hypothetical protein [Rhizomicrobium sp.]
MNAGWERQEADLAALKLSVAAMRENYARLGETGIERLLAPLRGCTVELIALRSSLEKIR